MIPWNTRSNMEEESGDDDDITNEKDLKVWFAEFIQSADLLWDLIENNLVVVVEIYWSNSCIIFSRLLPNGWKRCRDFLILLTGGKQAEEGTSAREESHAW